MADKIPDVNLPNLNVEVIGGIDADALTSPGDPRHRPRILLLYGSLQECSYSRLVAEESARILAHLGPEARLYNPSGLPLPDEDSAAQPKVVELSELAQWAEGMVWVSPERHGAMTGVMKSQID